MEFPSLSSPDRLLWLLPAALVLWWLAQPPRPRSFLFTAHGAQWRAALERARRKTPRFRALRWLLAMLTCAFLALAAAEPASSSDDMPVRVVFLIDGSASSAALGEDQKSAFDAAIHRVRNQAARIPSHVDVEVVIARGGSLSRWSGDAARLLSDPGLPAGQLPADLASLAAAHADKQTVVWAVGDGQGPSGIPPTDALWSPVGRAAANAALETVAVDDAWPLARIGVRATVVSHADVVLRGFLRLEGALLAPCEIPVELQPRAVTPVDAVAQRAPVGGLLRVSLQLEGDVLAVDDTHEFDVPPLPQTAIAVQAEEDDGLGFAAAAGRSLAAAVGGVVVDAAPGRPVGFLIAEGGEGAFPSDPGPVLAFGRKADGAQPWPSPLVVDWDRADPVLADLDLSELEIAHALRGSLPGGRSLVLGQLPDGSTAPLAVIAEGPRGKAYHFAFRLQDSNLGLLAAFPQLLLRCYEQSQPGSRAVKPRTAGIDPAESDLSRIEPTKERGDVRFAAQPADLSAWCVAFALALLALRSGIR